MKNYTNVVRHPTSLDWGQCLSRTRILVLFVRLLIFLLFIAITSRRRWLHFVVELVVVCPDTHTVAPIDGDGIIKDLLKIPSVRRSTKCEMRGGKSNILRGMRKAYLRSNDSVEANYFAAIKADSIFFLQSVFFRRSGCVWVHQFNIAIIIGVLLFGQFFFRWNQIASGKLENKGPGK